MNAKSLVLLLAGLLIGCADTTREERATRAVASPMSTMSAAVTTSRHSTNVLSKEDLGPCAQILPAEPVQVASREIVAVCQTQAGHPLYLVGYSADDYRGVWAAYTIDRHTADRNSKSGITRDKDGKGFTRSSEIPSNVQPSEKDYENNGKGLQRGHLAPAGAFKFNLAAYHSTFKVTNIAPQDGTMNRDIWGCLEGAIATDWAKKWDLLFVIVGGYATGGESTIGGGVRQITVPRYFFAIVYRADNKAVLAVEIPNNDKVVRNLDEYVTTVSNIERRGRMTLPLPDGAKTAKAKLSDWPNKCRSQSPPQS